MVEDHRRIAYRRQRPGDLAQGIPFKHGIELGPAGLGHAEMAELVGQRLELRGVARPGRAVQVEESADVDMSRLTGIEAMEHLDLHSRKEMRQVVARREHRVRLPITHAPHVEQAFALDQVGGAGAVEKPRGFAAAPPDGVL